MKEKVIEWVFEELRQAEKKFPSFPDDVVHASAIVSEEAGELTKACLDYFYGREPTKSKMIDEAIQVTAMGLRFLFNIVDLENGYYQ